MKVWRTLFWLVVLLLTLACFAVCRAKAVLPAPQDFGLRIARRADGLHALPYWYYKPSTYDPVASVWLWMDNPESGRELILKVHDRWDWPSIEFGPNDTITIVDLDVVDPEAAWLDAGGVSTFSVTDGTKQSGYYFGDYNMRWGASCSLASGGLFFVNYAQQGPAVTFDVNYRIPPVPPSPNAATPLPWWTNRYELPPDNGEIPSSHWAVAQMGGLIYVFLTRDSSWRIALARFKEDGQGSLSLVDWSPSFIADHSANGQNDPLACDGELPWIDARYDAGRQSIVVAYEAYKDSQFACYGRYCKLNIVSVCPTMNKELIMLTPFYCRQIDPLVVWARPEGIYYAQNASTLDPVCYEKYLLASTERTNTTDIDVGSHLASCTDGWMAYQASTGFVVRALLPAPHIQIARSSAITRAQAKALVAQFDANPALIILPAPQNASLTWDYGNTIEQTTNLVQWGIYATNATSPLLVPMVGAKSFFRVRQ